MPKMKAACVVELLDGTELIIENKRLNDTEELLNHVCEYIGVAERDYFGLKYTNSKDGEVSWLDMSEPLVKQLRKVQNHRFKLGIQFFPDTIHVLQDEVTRYQFVLQTRENLLTGRWSCSIPTQALLASYIVQAEFGNYDAQKHGTDYLDGVQFACVQKADFMEKVSLFHRNHRGISPSDADWLYMKTAGKMVMYGMDVYDVRDGDDNVLTFGVDVYGIHILFLNTVLHSFVWPLVTKVSCTGKEILITINVSSNDQSESINIGFILMTERDARRVAKSCTQHKDFHTSGAVKKQTKKPNKIIPCTHISTRVLPDDFKRVDSFEYSKLFERLTDTAVTYGDSDDNSERKDSMEEDSSKDTTTSFSDELNQTTQSADPSASNEQDMTEDSIAHIELSATGGADTTEDSVVHVDTPIHNTTHDISTANDSSGVVLSAEDIAVVQTVEETSTVHHEEVVEEQQQQQHVAGGGELLFEGDEQPLETSEVVPMEHIDVNVIIDNKEELMEEPQQEEEEEAPVVEAEADTHVAVVDDVVVDSHGIDEVMEVDKDNVDLLIMEEYDVIDTFSDVS